MVDIQYATAENRRGKDEEEEIKKERNHRTKILWPVLFYRAAIITINLNLIILMHFAKKVTRNKCHLGGRMEEAAYVHKLMLA